LFSICASEWPLVNRIAVEEPEVASLRLAEYYQKSGKLELERKHQKLGGIESTEQ